MRLGSYLVALLEAGYMRYRRPRSGLGDESGQPEAETGYEVQT